MGPYYYDYPRPAVTVDIVVFQQRGEALRVLLIERAKEPFAGRWALPGGFVDMDESLETAARRELQEETGLSDVTIHQVGAFGQPDRDPRGRVISIAYAALIPPDQPVHPQAGDDAGRAEWFDLANLPPLAFDHAEILAAARDKLSPRAGRA